MNAVRGAPARRGVFARVPDSVMQELQAAAAANGRSISAHTARVIEHGLRCDEVALHALLGWCWRIAGYLDGLGDSNAPAFADAIRKAEVGLGVRKPPPASGV